MSLNVSVKSGTNAGIRRPWVGGHSPKCACTKCEKKPRSVEEIEQSIIESSLRQGMRTLTDSERAALRGEL